MSLRRPWPVLLRCKYTLGDVVVLSAAVRDLHRAYPGAFRTSVETSAPAVWEHNPHISQRTFGETVVRCDPVELDRKGSTGRHYLHAYLDLINRRLGTSAQLTALKGDLHLSEQEKGWHSDIWSLAGREIPFWLVSSGGKFDIPLKWWDHRRYQEVIDAFHGRIQFVQVGAWTDHHPKLEGAIDLRGQTSVRDLIHLMHYARGVLSGVTSLMHLAAAVPTEHGGERPAVIIGGAREPASWEAYPHHEFISTERNLPCACCWKSQLRGGPNPCVLPAGDLPACLDLITSEEVIARFERLEQSGRIEFLRPRQLPFARKAVARAAAESDFDRHNITLLNAPAQAEAYIETIPPYPARRFEGRGIVICGGGLQYFPLAWICVRMLRRTGCRLPIELWHFGQAEIDRGMAALIEPFGVKCVDANRVMKRFPMRSPLGWELKAYALLHSSFREVLSLDADNVPILDPEFLFETPQYRATGAVFWPDYGELSPRRKIWRLCAIPYRKEPEFESGQLLVNKETCWRAVNLAWWYNDHSEFFYRYIYGDKDTFHMAWRKLGQRYAMTSHPIGRLEGTMCQHDFDGRRVFQHRNTPKFLFFGENRRLPGFEVEEVCLDYLGELRSKWDGLPRGAPALTEGNGWRFRTNTLDEAVYTSVVIENEYRLPGRLDPSATVLDIGAHIGSFAFACHGRGSRDIVGFEPNAENYRLARSNTRTLEGVRLRRGAVLDRPLAIDCESYPGYNGLRNTGGGKVRVKAGGGARSVAIDDLLRQLGQVALMKLDCEGSEWPILLHGAEWGRVGAVCGEYHLFHEYVKEEFGISNTLAPPLLFDRLTRHFAHVSIERPNHEGLGRFWASRKKNFFARAVRNVSFIENSSA